MVCYTDGGSQPNPGPTGAGAAVYFPLPPDKSSETPISLKKAISLGQGTNNIGELAAIGLAMDLIAEGEEKGYLGGFEKAGILILTDSKYAKGVLLNTLRPKANLKLIAEVKSKLEKRRAKGNEVKFHYVKGHT